MAITQVPPGSEEFRWSDDYGSLSDQTPMDAPLPIRSGCDAATFPPRISLGNRYGFTLVRTVLGALLLVAAGLKLADNGLETASSFRPFTSPFWHLAAAEVEALLGLWLLLGLAPRVLWSVALLFFFAMAGVSLYLGIEGQPSCGCFGTKLPVRPWLSFTMDLTSVASLVWWRPLRIHKVDVSYSVAPKWIFAITAGSGAILAIVFGILTWMYGSLYEGLLHIRSEPVAVEPGVTQVGDGLLGSQRTFFIKLTNQQDKPVTVFGGSTDCLCITTDDLPIIMPSNGSQWIAVRIKYRGNPGYFEHSFVLYTDDEVQQAVTASFAGRVIESSSP